MTGNGKEKQRLVYLDYAADCPYHPDIKEAIDQAYHRLGRGVGANPSSLHAAGRRAKEFLEESRARVADAIGADPQEVVFTGGGTQADTLAVTGLALGRYRAAPALRRIIYSAVEHDAIDHSAKYCGQSGLRPARAKVDRDAVVDMAALRQQLWEEEPALVAVMSVCNENGVIQPVRDVVDLVREAEADAPWDRQATAMAGATHVPVVSDAIQALGRVPIDFHGLGVDALSLAAHKVGGPANSGVLVVKRDVLMDVPGKGASQERGIRAGTQDVVAAAAMAATVELAEKMRVEEGRRIGELADYLVAEACKNDGVELASRATKVPHIRQFVLHGCEAESVLFAFDQQGICVSAGSACRAGVARPSPILLAQGYTSTEAMGSLRVSMGWATTRADIDAFLAQLPHVLTISRRFAGRKNGVC